MTLLPQRSHGSKHPGQMTAMMRASASALAARQGPKVLRVGLVQEGRVREERTLRSPADVSFGTSDENTFLLGEAAYPTTFRLFERIGETYHLNFTDEMQGRVALASGLFELHELRGRAQRVRGGAFRIPLTDEARGRVTLGQVLFLFHFVEASPTLPKAVLPAAVLSRSRSIDWTSTICAAASFFLHFMILGAVYSDWLDPVIDDDSSTAGLIDSLRNLPPPPPLEVKSLEDEPPTPVREQPPAPQAKPSKTPTPAKDGAVADRAPSPSQSDSAALTNQLARMDASILGSLRTSKPATSAVFQRGEVAWGVLDSVAASAAGVGSGSGPQLGSNGPPIRPGTFKDLREFGTSTRGPEGPGRVASVQGPNVIANVAPPSTSGGLVSNAAKVVAGMRAGFRACYQRGLAADPDASGSIRLTIRVGAGGEVSGVTASPAGNLPGTVVSCVQARAQVAQFDAPQGGAAVIVVPVTFVKQ
ncbi:MAG TPA: AgmX/PglI C-terminal domain-containing protein [Polyangiaceae bacterium]|nr:AgmX/PglI C-terminal domain-containing protein [Polyangiaceae bacterium]